MASKKTNALRAREYMAIKAMTRMAGTSAYFKTEAQNTTEHRKVSIMKKSLKKLLLASAAIEELGVYASNRRVLDKHVDLLSAAAELAAEVNNDGKVASRFDIPEKCIPAARRGINNSHQAADKNGGWDTVKADYLNLQCDTIDALIAEAEKPASKPASKPAQANS